MNTVIIDDDMILEDGNPAETAEGLMWNALDVLRGHYDEYGDELFDTLAKYVKLTEKYEKGEGPQEKKDFYEGVCNVITSIVACIDMKFGHETIDDNVAIDSLINAENKVRRAAEKIVI